MSNSMLVGTSCVTDANNEDDRKPQAMVASTSPLEAQATSSDTPTTSPLLNNVTSLRQQRSFYADAFLARCNKVDPNDFDLPKGTYICPWMPAEPVPEYGNTVLIDEVKWDDMSYRASHCELEELSLAEAMVITRLDTRSTLQTRDRKNDFGSHCYQASLLPSDVNTFPGYSPCAVQCNWTSLKEILVPIAFGTLSPEYRMGVNYTKEAVWAYNLDIHGGDDDIYDDLGKRHSPFTPYFSVPSGGVNPGILANSVSLTLQQHGGPQADVWTTENLDIAKEITPLLDDLALQTSDCPLPRYQMIIDPNQFVCTRKADMEKVWVPCEFDVTTDGSTASLVGGDRAHWMGSELINSVATPVLNAALPLLAKLTKPYLLLEGQRLQVVVKAQSITLPKSQSDDDTPEYIGLWHVDGEHEPVAAVVLYYYSVDDALVGGNMEFLDRRPMGLLGYGDTSLADTFDPGSVKQAIRPDADSSHPVFANCSVPIKTGTLLVFSNYQMAHRVLRMINTSQQHIASRKFVALFVLDPAAERLIPSRCHLAYSYLLGSALTGKCEPLCEIDASQHALPENVSKLVMEYLGVVPSAEMRRFTRNELLRSQLTPKYFLGRSEEMVCCTGNGCYTMIGWIDILLKNDEVGQGPDMDDLFYDSERRFNAMNFPPIGVDRGLSETFSVPSDDLSERYGSYMNTLNELKETLNADMEKMN